MNPFWSMSSSVCKWSDGEEKTFTGDVITCPPCASPKTQLPSSFPNALLITKLRSPAPAIQSAHGTHASYQPSPWNTLFLTEFTLLVKEKLPGLYTESPYCSALMWFGVLFRQHGLHQDDVFKFTSPITSQMVNVHAGCLICPSFTC